MKKLYIITLAFFLFLTPLKNFAQTPGIIVRPAGTNGPLVLDPNADGYTSTTTAGFGTDDIANSEIHYKVVNPVVPEPTGDLLKGPTGSFSDLVKTVDGSGFYLFNDGTNFLCRVRLGGIASGAKAYSILLDTDSKFGNVGAYADPNYQPATTGSNGNPGFELEVVLETNVRVAVYNVDGTSTPVLIGSYPISSNSQISVAASNDGGDPDYFYDFYIPYSVMGISTSTPIRASATSVMSPLPAIGGPKSDIYGVSGGDYMSQWTTAILSQSSFTLNDITSPGTGIGATCTDAPILNGPIVPTATTVTGTWTKSSFSSIATATITLFKGVVAIGTTSVSSGGIWSITVSGLSNNDVLTAKAQGSGESMCLSSNAVTVNACNSTNLPATPILSCTSGSKGVNGTNLSTGWTIHVDNMTRNVFNNSVTNTGGLFGANTGSSPAITWQYSGGCVGGSPLASGSYKIYYTDNVTGCNSEPAYFCAAGNGPNSLAGSLAIPIITTPSNGIYTPATTSISGSTTAAVTLTLYVDGLIAKTTTASGAGAFTFSNLTLSAGQQIYIIAELNSGTVGTSYCSSKTSTFTVTCFTNSPLIAVGNSNQLTTGLPITGTSSEPAGTTIRVYTSTNVLVAATAVQANGTWSTANAGTIPAAYNAVAATSYYANAQNGTCGVSSNSATFATASITNSARCGTLPASVTENATSVSGTLSGTALAGTVVTLYADGTAIGNYTTANLAYGPIPVNTTVNNTIYAGAVLTIGIAEPSANEVTCAASVTVSCAIPAAPVINPTSSAVVIGQTVSYTISSSQVGILYSLRDNLDATNVGESAFGNGSTITLLSDPFNTAGTITINAKATSFSGANCESLAAATVVVTAPLPVSLINFEGIVDKGIAKLKWSTSSEQNLDFFEVQKSYTGDNFKKSAIVKAVGNSQVTLNYANNDSSVSAAVVYYRLKMVDKDNSSFKYSNVIALRADKGMVLNYISPNPFISTIKIKLDVGKDAPLVVSLSDMTGRKIKTMHYAAKQGSNTFILSGLNTILSGTYFIELNTGEGNITRQLLIKQ